MKKYALFIADIATLYGALALTLLIRYGAYAWSAQFALHALPFAIIFVLWLLIFYIANLYESAAWRNSMAFFGTLWRSIVTAAILSIAFFYLIPAVGIAPRTNLLIFIVLFGALQSGIRALLNLALARGTKKSILIVGKNARTMELADLIQANPHLGYTVGWIADISPQEIWEPGESRATLQLLTRLEEVERVIQSGDVDIIIISPEAYASASVVSLCYRTLGRHVTFFSVAAFYEQITGKVPLDSIDQAWFLENLNEGAKRSYETFKRATDIILAIALGIPTLCIMPFIAIAIALDSPGPIFFRQQRSGRTGTTFAMLKLRTMRQNAEQHTGAVWAQANDPRVTRIGAFLRKSRIDELPQLWNVLKGEMSLVGPRAERPEFDRQLVQQVPFYEERYLIKPGLTGWAQIKYSYGASVKDAAEKLQFDLFYIKHRSLLLDLEILLKTINIAARRAGR